MDDNTAYVISQSVCALIEALGMYSDNQQQLAYGEETYHSESAFDNLIEKYGIDHNSVVKTLNNEVKDN